MDLYIHILVQNIKYIYDYAKGTNEHMLPFPKMSKYLLVLFAATCYLTR